PVDEVLDLRVVEVQAHHLGGATGGAAALGAAGRTVEDLEEAHQTAAGATARELLLATTDGAEVGAGARAVLEEARLVADHLVDGHEVVLDGLDEAGRALGVLIGVGGLGHLVALGVPEPVAPLTLDAVALVETAVEPDRAVERGHLV